MKYNININQYAIIENELNLDLVDACLLNYLCDFALSSKIIKVPFENEVFYFFNHNKIVDDLPILKFKKDRVYRRLKNLCDLGFLKQHPQSKALNMTLYSFTDKIELLMFSEGKKVAQNTIGQKTEPSAKTPKGIGENTEGPSAKTPMYNNINNNNINYKNESALDFLQKTSPMVYESLMMKYKSKIKDFDIAVENFNLTFDKEDLKYEAKIINSRAQLYFNNWMRNKDKWSPVVTQNNQEPQAYQKTRF